MNISIANGFVKSYCQKASVTATKCRGSHQAVVAIEGVGFHYGADERKAVLDFRSPDEIEVLIQHLKKVQAELNLRLLKDKKGAA